MSMSKPLSRAITGVLLVGLVAASGCSWFRKGDALYTHDPANRPLEVPPPLELPGAGATTASGMAASSQPAASAPAAAGGFVIAGPRDAAFERVGEALAAIPGVTVASRAQLLGAFDLGYEGSNFLVRVSEAGEGVAVSVVDPRGLPASGEAPAKLMAQLKAALGGN
jgi:uncharacterized lipoprotein